MAGAGGGLGDRLRKYDCPFPGTIENHHMVVPSFL